MEEMIGVAGAYSWNELDKDGQENSRKKESGTVQIEMSG
jgi:hypothetical protein